MHIGQCGFGLLGVWLCAATAAVADLPPEWDEQPALVISGPLYRVLENGQWGFMDKSGAVAIPAKFDTATDFSEGRACVAAERQHFILKDDGALIRSEPLRSPFREGRAFAGNSMGNVKILDENGKVILAGLKDFEPYSDGWALVRMTNGWGYVDRAGQVVLTITNTVHSAPEQHGPNNRHTRPHPFANGRSRVFMGHEKWAYLDKSGKIAIPARFERAHDFAEGLARVRLNGKWGFIKPDGAFAVEPTFEDARDFSEDLAAVMLGGKWGYVDPAGKLAIPPRFDKPQRFQEGLALVWQGEKVGFMNKQGQVVIAPVFDGARGFKDGLAMVWAGTRRGYINPKSEWIYVRDTLFAP